MTVRVIPRLDIKGPNLVKGLSFDCYRALGTAEQFARIYYEDGADELIYYDAVASLYQRNSLTEIVERTAKDVFIPLTVVGGLRSVDDIRKMLRSGADKVAINTAAIANPELIRNASRTFGSQCILVSIEAKQLSDGRYEAWVDYGRQPTGVDAIDWAQRAVELGAGELLVTSVDNEGMGVGYDIDLIASIATKVPVPVIACGGAGAKAHASDVVKMGSADAVSAASIFHYHYMQGLDTLYMSSDQADLRMGKQIDEGNVDYLKTGLCGGLPWTLINPASIPDVKSLLTESGIPVRRQDEYQGTVAAS
ncbi:imidazole glycerol phosphate synthase cyclase subunit [Dehalococcoidia bacterium]|nr:imidazole glycerol phosphate synthase cyclase subunit [Dehalococcoidia bacterium]